MNSSTPLGVHGRNSEALAWRLYHEFLELAGRGDVVKTSAYPQASLGAFFEAYRKTPTWSRKKPTTRTEWENCWKYLDPIYGRRIINQITPGEFESFAYDLEDRKGINIRWRVVKIAKALFNAAVKHHVLSQSPAAVVKNTQPKGRSQYWFAAEISRLVMTANDIGKPAMSLAIRIGWETALSPVDVRSLNLDCIESDAFGAWIDTSRSKTGSDVIAAISDRLHKDIRSYVNQLGIVIPSNQPFLRTSRDSHEYLKPRFLSDFRLVREAAFGENEKRRFQDIRRSANLEAQLGDASPDERAEMLANTLNKDSFLEKTYTPKTVQRSRQIRNKRLEGRNVLAVQSVNTTGGDGK